MNPLTPEVPVLHQFYGVLGVILVFGVLPVGFDWCRYKGVPAAKAAIHTFVEEIEK